MKIVRLTFKHSVHFGADNQGIGKENVQDIVHSDTIFSLLVNSAASLFGYDQKKIEDFINSIKALSSGFLFERTGLNTYEYYLPRPLFDPHNFYDIKHGLERKLNFNKDLKKCSFVHMKTFINWIQGSRIDLSGTSKAPYKKLFASVVRPQHARDRLTHAAVIYFVGEIFFKHNAGIYFFIDGFDDNNLLNSILDVAAINGLGGRRSAGNGSFDYDIAALDDEWKKIFSNDKANSFLTLSLFYPLKEERSSLKPLSYSVIKRKGWTFTSITSGQFKRKSCTMFGEGSVFKNKPQGCLINVKPDIFKAHPVYRFGKALSIPCFTQEVT